MLIEELANQRADICDVTCNGVHLFIPNPDENCNFQRFVSLIKKIFRLNFEKLLAFNVLKPFIYNNFNSSF